MMLKSKYVLCRIKFIDFYKGFFIQKDIGKGWNLYKENVWWDVGDGKVINLWYDNWMGLGNLMELIQGLLLEGEENFNLRIFLGLGLVGF